MSSPYDIWTPATADTPEPRPSSWRRDLAGAGAVVVSCVLLGAPAGLVWSAVAPRLQVQLTADGVVIPNVESSKAFIGADGSLLVVMLAMGLLTGVLAWVFARKYGPWTVAGLLIGGLLAAQVAAAVGLRPGASEAQAALNNPQARGTVELYLGKRKSPHSSDLTLRAPWVTVGWPVAALGVFAAFGLRRPEEFD